MKLGDITGVSGISAAKCDSGYDLASGGYNLSNTSDASGEYLTPTTPPISGFASTPLSGFNTKIFTVPTNSNFPVVTCGSNGAVKTYNSNYYAVPMLKNSGADAVYAQWNSFSTNACYPVCSITKNSSNTSFTQCFDFNNSSGADTNARAGSAAMWGDGCAYYNGILCGNDGNWRQVPIGTKNCKVKYQYLMSCPNGNCTTPGC
jgi:hypothetical protein